MHVTDSTCLSRNPHRRGTGEGQGIWIGVIFLLQAGCGSDQCLDSVPFHEVCGSVMVFAILAVRIMEMMWEGKYFVNDQVLQVSVISITFCC